jgi:riboflavin synthase
MFTGIVEAIGKVTGLKKNGSESRLTLTNPFGSGIGVGDSISVDGVCLTVESFDQSEITFFLSEMTLKRSIAGSYRSGTRVNLERAMAADGRFGGHIVQGHVDTKGILGSVRKIGQGIEITVRFDREFSDFVVQRGSVCINGVSLTTAEVTASDFTVSLIPETLRKTALEDSLRSGSAVNLEFDIVGKYVANLVKKRSPETDFESLLAKL